MPFEANKQYIRSFAPSCMCKIAKWATVKVPRSTPSSNVHCGLLSYVGVEGD